MTMRKDVNSKARSRAFHGRTSSIAEYDALAGRVLAARASLMRDGVYPSNARIARAAGIRGVDVGAITDILCGGTLVEHPDDPDAAEIQARIAEVRAGKEAYPPRRSVEVARGRFHHPTHHKGSHQRIVA